MTGDRTISAYYGKQLNIYDLAKNGALDDLQEKLSMISGMAFLTVDFRGEPVTKPAGFTGFCTARRQGKCSGKNCCLSNALGGAAAAISNEPYYFRCPCGLLHLAISIVVKEQYLGTLIGGQVKCEDAGQVDDFGQRLPKGEDWREDEALNRAYEEIPEVSFDKIKQVAELAKLYIEQLCEKMALLLENGQQDVAEMAHLQREKSAEGAAAKLPEGKKKLTAPEETVSKEKDQEQPEDGKGALAKSIQEKKIVDTFRLCRKLSADIFSLYYKEGERQEELEKLARYGVNFIGTMAAGKQEHYEKKYQLVPEIHKYPCIAEAFLHFLIQDVYRVQMLSKYPQFNVVISYVHNHMDKEITLNEVAEVGAMSTGYITRIFKRYYGIGVVDYSHLIKILWAKLYLACTELSITDISYSLGYNDPGYFGKVFKKYEGMPPSFYKRSYDCQGYNINDSFRQLMK